MMRHLISGIVLGAALFSVGCACHKHCGTVSNAPPCCGGGGPVAVPATPVVPVNPAPVPPPPATSFSNAAPCPNCYNH